MPRQLSNNLIPFGENGLTPDFLYTQREYYLKSTEIYPVGPNIPRPIDIWYQRPLWGKVDTFQSPIIPKNKYLNGYTIQIFSGLEREKADSIFFTADSIYSELEIYTLYDQPNYRVKVGKYFYRINANKALNKLINDFSEAIIVPERIKIN